MFALPCEKETGAAAAANYAAAAKLAVVSKLLFLRIAEMEKGCARPSSKGSG